MTKNEVLQLLDATFPQGGMEPVMLATWDGSCPRVRAMLAARDGLSFYFGTGCHTAKAKEMTACAEVEVLALLRRPDGAGQLRIAGRAIRMTGKTLHDAWAKAKGYDVRMFMKGGLDDPDFAAFRIEVKRALLMRPGTMSEETLPLDWFA